MEKNSLLLFSKLHLDHNDRKKSSDNITHLAAQFLAERVNFGLFALVTMATAIRISIKNSFLKLAHQDL